MYSYGHGSWIAIVVLVAVFAIRALTSSRRRDRGAGRSSPSSSFTASRPPPGVVTETGRAAGSGVAPGWFVDPTGRHDQRYWSGTAWSEHVVDDGVPGTDPPPPAPPRRGSDPQPS